MPMLFQVSDLRRIRYWPEKLPATAILNIPAGQRYTIVELRQFQPFMYALTDLTLPRYPDVRLDIDRDGNVFQRTTAALRDKQTESWFIPATKNLNISLTNQGTTEKSNYLVRFAIWGWRPTTVDKLQYGIELLAEDKLLVDELGLRDTWDKGLLPLPLSYQLERQYQVLEERIYSREVTLQANISSHVESIVPETPGTALIVTKIAATPSGVADRIRVRLDRDEDKNYIEVETVTFGTEDDDVSVWIPALRNLDFYMISATALTVRLRVHVLVVRLTNILRARWGLEPIPGTPTDEWESVQKRVRGGVL